MVSWKQAFAAKTNSVDGLCFLLMIYSGHSDDLLRPSRPRRGGRAAECGGLLTPTGHFAI